MRFFADRTEAGKRLASALLDIKGKNAIVLAIPRGGIVVGFEIADALGIPLDVTIPRKIGAPDNPELAIGAVTEDGTIILNERLVKYLHVSEDYIKGESETQRLEIERRLKNYRGEAPYPDLENREVIIVDDGIATGATMKAALASVRKKGAKTVIIAVPVGPASTIRDLEKEADRVVCLHTPESFGAIGQFYEDFAQTEDDEVVKLLKLSQRKQVSLKKKNVAKTGTQEESLVRISVNKAAIEGNLMVPAGAKGLVLFAHGSGSSRFSPRNQYVAKMLNKAGIATLLIDLLTKQEEEIDARTSEFRFDIDLLSERLMATTEWLKKNPTTKNLFLGYFGASTGAAAALIAAAKSPDNIKAIVSRGGRPDLAMEWLPKVKAPTLFLVGGRDTVVIELNKKAMENLLAEKKLEIVSGASHLFEETGKLEEVVRLSIKWFAAKLS